MRDFFGAKGDRGCGEANETAISSVWLMNGVGIVVAKIVDNFADALVVFLGDGFADDTLESVIA